MTDWLRVLSNLLPRGRAWKLWPGSMIRAFLRGLVDGLIKPAREQFDRVYLDLFPQTTRELDRWERQWGLRPGSLTEQERRDRLEAQWKALGGQSPRYLQDTLRGAGFDVYVHEWWEPGSNPPTARDPLDVVSGGAGYFLVNKLTRSLRVYSSVAGARQMVAGNRRAVAGVLVAFVVEPVQYEFPDTAASRAYVLYIGGETYPNAAQVPASRRDEFEELVLKTCPAQQWLALLVEYT